MRVLFYFLLLVAWMGKLVALPCDEPPLVECMRGLILVGDPSEVLQSPPALDGVFCVGLDAPYGNDALAERIAPLIVGQPLSNTSIARLKREIVLYYRECDHPVVMVYVPEQTVCNGVFQLVVLEACVGDILVKGNCYTPDDWFVRFVRADIGGRINERLLLEDVSWMNTNPFRRVNVLYSPGEENGTTNIELHVTERKPWRVYVGGDNTGTPRIGRERWFIGCNVANIFFPDHLFTYQYTTSSNFRKFQSHTFQYVAPFAWRDTLSLFGGYATAHPTFEPFRSEAKTSQISGRYSMPNWYALCGTLLQHNFEIGFDYKTTNNNLIFGEDNSPIIANTIWISQFVFGSQLALNKKLYRTQLGVELFWSPGELLSHQTMADFEALREGASPRYAYGRLNYSIDLVLPFRWSLWAQARLQLTNSNLISSEQFPLGGFYTVRGYDERIVNGDNAACINIELRTLACSPCSSCCSSWPKDSLVFLGYVDAARGWDNEQITGLPLEQRLLGIGPGIRYNVGSWFSARFDLGYPLIKVEGQTNKLHYHFSLLLNY